MDNNSQKEPSSKIETPTPKSRFEEESPVFKYINNLSPIEPVKSISTVHTFSSLSFTSPPVFSSPHLAFHRESRFFRCHNSVDRGSKAVGSVSKEEFVASADVDLNKDVTLEDDEEATSCELPQVLKSPDHGDSPPSDPPPEGGIDSSSEDVRMSLLKILDDTPGCRRLMGDAAELLVFLSPNDSEAFTCLVDKISSSERRFFAGVKQPTKQHDDIIPANGSSIDNESLPVSKVHRGSMRRRCLDFDVPGKRRKDDQQTVCDDKHESSSSKCVVPGIGLHLNAIAMASRNTKISITHEYSTSGEIKKSSSGSITPVHSLDNVPEALDQAEREPGEESAIEKEVPKELVLEELIPDSLQKKNIR